MKLIPSNRILAFLFIVILALSLTNTYLIIYYNDALQKQRNQDVSDLNQAINQTNSSLAQTNASLDKTNASLDQTSDYLNQKYTSLNQTTYVIQDLLNGKIDNLNARLPIEQYDYIIYRNWDYESNASVYLMKNGRTGTVEFNSTDGPSVFNKALTNGNSVFVKSDTYNLTSDVYISNKKNSRLDSDGATLNMFGNKLIVSGANFERSQYNQISGFIVVNGTLRVENSFQTTVTDMIFENCSVGIELANTNTWTEGTRIDTVHFDKCSQSLVFRTNTTNAALQSNSTGSYANTEVVRCYFNLLDNAVAINVEPKAEFTDSLMQDVRIWIGEFGKFNQTGLQLDGSMYKTLMTGVVFESFAPFPLDNAYLYAMKLGSTAYQSPTLDSGVNILGNWTARIFNPCGIWVYGVGGVFKQDNITVPVGSNGYGKTQVIQVHPATISSFEPKITVQGNFSGNETVVVRLRLEFLDNRVSNSVEKSFNSSGSMWLSNDDFLQLYAYPDVIYAILVDARASPPMTNVVVTVDVFGSTS